MSKVDPPCSVPQTSQCMWLMQALGFLLSALQVEEILKNLHSLISPYIQQLEKLAEEIVSELGCVWLERGKGETLGLPFMWAMATEEWGWSWQSGLGPGDKLALGDPELGSLLPIA